MDKATTESQNDDTTRTAIADALRAFKEEAFATEPEPDADVQLFYPSSHRHYSYTRVTGKRPEVLAYVSYRLKSDRVSKHYEHMALRVVEVTPGEDGCVSVLLSKNLYAGD